MEVKGLLLCYPVLNDNRKFIFIPALFFVATSLRRNHFIGIAFMSFYCFAVCAFKQVAVDSWIKNKKYKSDFLFFLSLEEKKKTLPNATVEK